ncbi:MAG: hypothetical protein PHH85_10455 [Candidatus Methanoperedens sp.]|nr:hypothetical protein [Candidatus Methanoperedens sp.]
MKHIKFIQVVFIVILLSSFLSGCMEKTKETPAATPAQTVKETAVATTPTIAPAETERTKSNYIVYIDDYSFYRVIESTYKNVVYENFTFSINVGDNVKWDSNTVYDDILTIISDQGLWANGSARLMNNKEFNYTFLNPGTYTFRIKEEKKILPQTIIVKP